MKRPKRVADRKKARGAKSSGKKNAGVGSGRGEKFHVSHATSSDFDTGLRGYFEYRDLGIKGATGGKVVGHVIRARPGEAPHGEWHWHECEVQFVYVLKGWAKFEYEGVGEVLMQAGTCFYQPPGIRHREIGHSEDLEMLEVVAPGNFKTYTAKESA
jgi:mannose-6-phosphate isomerase-like protein (cupin superfamily)